MFNINEYEGILTDSESIHLRNYIGLIYRVTEDLDGFDVDDYEVKKLNSKRLYVDENSFFAIFDKEFETTEDSRKAFDEIKQKFKDNGKKIYDYSFNKDKKQLTVVIEPHVV